MEAAIAYDDPDLRIRTRYFRADGCWQRESHGSKAAGGNQRTWLFMFVILRFPHLVLANVCHHDGIALASLTPEIVNHVCGVEMTVVGKILNVPDGSIAFQFVYVMQPFSAIGRFDFWE